MMWRSARLSRITTTGAPGTPASLPSQARRRIGELAAEERGDQPGQLTSDATAAGEAGVEVATGRSESTVMADPNVVRVQAYLAKTYW